MVKKSTSLKSSFNALVVVDLLLNLITNLKELIS